MKMKLTTTLAAALLAASASVALAAGSGSSMNSGASANTGTSATTANKATGCKTLASKEEKGKQGSVPNSSSHNATAGTTGSGAKGKPEKGC